MTEEKTVRVGIVGCGIIAQWQHIPSFLRLKGAEIAAICDRDRSVGQCNVQYLDLREGVTGTGAGTGRGSRVS